MPEPAKSFLRFGGGAIAIFGTSSLVFWELASKKYHRPRPQLLLSVGQNVVPHTGGLQQNNLSAGQNFIPNTVSQQNHHQPISEAHNNREHFVERISNTQQPSDLMTKRLNNYQSPSAIPNFYQTSELASSLPNEKTDTASQFQPQSNAEDKYAPVKSLVYENTVGIVGKEKGSGKTSKLGYLIGEHIKLGHLVWMVNPFAKGQQWKGIKVFGRGYNFVEATDAIREFTRIARGRIAEAGDETKEYEPFEDYHLHLSLDEMSNYSSEIDAIDSTVMPKFWEAVVQFLRQANMSVSFASHGDTQAMLGGAKALAGKSETIKDAIIWLYAQAITDRNVEGNKRCAGWGYLIRPDGGDRQKIRVEIPNWMQGPPATRLDGKDKYNYTQMVQKYCPQFLYLPASNQKTTQDTPINTEQFRQKLIEQEDIWGLDGE